MFGPTYCCHLTSDDNTINLSNDQNKVIIIYISFSRPPIKKSRLCVCVYAHVRF